MPVDRRPVGNAGVLLTASAGRDLAVDERVARSEPLLGDRNHALAHLIRSEGSLQVGPDDAVAVYALAWSSWTRAPWR